MFIMSVLRSTFTENRETRASRDTFDAPTKTKKPTQDIALHNEPRLTATELYECAADNFSNLRTFRTAQDGQNIPVRTKYHIWNSPIGVQVAQETDDQITIQLQNTNDINRFELASVVTSTEKQVYVEVEAEAKTQFVHLLLAKYNHLLTSDLEEGSDVFQPFQNMGKPVSEILDCGVDFKFFTQYCNSNMVAEKDIDQYRPYLSDVLQHTTRPNLIEYGYTPIQAYNVIQKLKYDGDKVRRGRVLKNNKVLWDGEDQACEVNNGTLVKYLKTVLYNELKSEETAQQFCEKLKSSNTVSEELLGSMAPKTIQVTVANKELTSAMVWSYIHSVEMAQRFGETKVAMRQLMDSYLEKAVKLNNK